jgi:hypothetical protein
MAVGVKKASSLLDSLRAKKYTFEERRRIVETLVDRVVVKPHTPGVPYAECDSIDFKFHWERPRWDRKNRTPVTAVEAEAGAAGLLLASGATLRRSGWKGRSRS